MASQSNVISIMTYNCHGFQQAKTLLNSVCNSNDNLNSPTLIYLQELWLTPDNMHKIANFSNNYMFYGISAMEHAVSSSVLIGRPWGGVRVLIKNNFAKLIRYKETCERFVCIVIGTTVFL